MTEGRRLVDPHHDDFDAEVVPTYNNNNNNNNNNHRPGSVPQHPPMQESATSSSSSFPRRKEQGGVADYFAVLGIGDTLVWKHAPPPPSSPPLPSRRMLSPSSNNNNDDNNGNEPKKTMGGGGDDDDKNKDDINSHYNDVPAEDDAKMLERFYREIIDCQIWVAEENPHTPFPSTVGYGSTNGSTTTRSATKNHRASQTVVVSSLPTSPSPSDVTSFSTPGGGIDLETAASLEGWTVIKQTRPAASVVPTAKASHQEIPPLWNQRQTWDANLNPEDGLSSQIAELELEHQRKIDGRRTTTAATPLRDLRHKVQTSFQQRLVSYATIRTKKKFYLSFRRRSPAESTVPAIADLALFFVRLHKATIPVEQDSESQTVAGGSEKTENSVSASTSVSHKGTAALLRVAEAGKLAIQSGLLRGNAQQQQQQQQQQPSATASSSVVSQNSMDYDDPIHLDSLLDLPSDSYEWSIPEPYRELRFPRHPPTSNPPYKSVLFVSRDQGNDVLDSGIEVVQQERTITSLANDTADWRSHLQPKVFPANQRLQHMMHEDDDEHVFVPILAIRRQRIGEEERFHEDPAIVDMSVSFLDQMGNPVLPFEEVDPFEEESNDAGSIVLDKSAWALVNTKGPRSTTSARPSTSQVSRSDLGAACILVRRNLPLGFCDAAFSTSVLDRFPYRNYKGLPLPEEELPMFCYPTGCRLHRAKFSDAPLPEYYGFVVKNERGDSIYVSCVSFMEPLLQTKQKQLERMSDNRRRVSLPHAKFWAQRERRRQKRNGVDQGTSDTSMMDLLDDESDDSEHDEFSNMLMTGFDDMVTFEKKTICLISRYPYWTAFRRFLSHLLSISASPSDIPLERYISHLLLAVPLPSPGGPSILIPLPTFNMPMMLWAPPSKDLPILDLPYERLVSCLDIPTLVTIVLGFLALERKVIVMSTRPSLVLDVCELLRSLLFPFDLCAPYVPRLTEPFVRTLDFPGAVFVGIHDDGSLTGLAATVRQSMPEESTIVDLDSGTLDCSGDRMAVLKNSWGIIPPGPRSILLSELETLCRDAGIVAGQEPLDSLVDPAFEATMPSTPVQDDGTLMNEHKEPLDDRCIRDAFLRFFCSVLGGYERHLVVPDVDFLVSGNEWFDSNGFLAAVPEENAAFLGTLVSTQLFQSFIQRRTEASDVHCLLFDECLAEYHSSPAPYGRLGADVETIANADPERSQLLYSLLVDQCASRTTPGLLGEKSFDGDSSRHGSDAESSGNNGKGGDSFEYSLSHAEFAKNMTGDWVTLPSRFGLSSSARYIYCVDGNPTFPDRLNPYVYLPRQPESWLVEMSTVPTPMLTRSGKEIEESDRRRKVATTYRGLPTHRRCLWQLPKLMGSQFLGAWLLCIPVLVSQPLLTNDQQSKYLLRALGALRLLRNKQRIVPDEAAYRALIVACGRTMSDRRVELVKLFGLLRSDGIFPSAVTLGQYTKALAEGYSKHRSSGGTVDDETGTVDLREGTTRGRHTGNFSRVQADDPEATLSLLDGDLTVLEESGRKWRQKTATENAGIPNQQEPKPEGVSSKSSDRSRKKSSKSWLPVLTSCSWAPSRHFDAAQGGDAQQSASILDKTHLLAMWSRTQCCTSCGYIPLDEEVQAGWDVYGGEGDIPGAINCPRCGEVIIPKLGYRALSIGAALAVATTASSLSLPQLRNLSSGDSDGGTNDQNSLPPQMRSTIDEIREASYVTYLSPASLRLRLERHVDEHGEDVLERHRLREHDPEVLYNLWFYSARFSLPLPLPVSHHHDKTHYCAMVGWDYEVALRGCVSAAKVLHSVFGDNPTLDAQPALNDLEIDQRDPLEALGDHPLLARFNLQGYYATVWDHKDLSKVLVKLVEACDKRDFRPVVECLSSVNKRRRDSFNSSNSGVGSVPSSNVDAGGSDAASRRSLVLMPPLSEGNDSTALWLTTTHNNVEFECYRTALYLAKYQCTSAFHTFFPAVLKPCKGYHFWCPIAPVPIFDRLLNEAIQRSRAKSSSSGGVSYIPIHDVSEVALGFRSVFGHLM